MKTQWPQLIQPRVTSHRDGYFFIKCINAVDVNLIVYSGPYSMGGRPVVVKKWSTEFDFERDVLRAMPI